MVKLKHLLEEKDSNNVAGIAYIVGDELLCVQSTSGRWGIPKGHRHIGESPEDGALREFTEETQIIINGFDLELSHIAKKKNGGDFHVFICKGDKKINAHINYEHKDWGYFSLMELPETFDNRLLPMLDVMYEASKTGNIRGLKGATGFIKPEEWDAKKKSLKKSIEKTTGYLLLERVDLLDTAEQLIKHYGLKSKVRFTSGKNMADYDWVRDVINLRKNYPTIREFLITVLHEIRHALDRKKMGMKKYEKAYAIAGEMAVQKGGDFHDDNVFEERAEKWGVREYKKWKNKI